MDLGAYANIENLSAIASANGINIPRLRGYRLMAEEMPVIKEELEMEIYHQTLSCIEDMLLEMASGCYEISARTRRLIRKHMILESEFVPIGIRWERLHGKRRKKAKYLVKKVAKTVSAQYNMFNKYCGRDDVLYIHARIGGANWIPYGGKTIEKEPWFIEKIDDAFDNTYCDIYARIDPLKEVEA